LTTLVTCKTPKNATSKSVLAFSFTVFESASLSATLFLFRFLSFSVSGTRQCDQRVAGDWVFLAPVQLLAEEGASAADGEDRGSVAAEVLLWRCWRAGTERRRRRCCTGRGRRCWNKKKKPNSSEMTLKMLTVMQIYQKCIFFLFSLFFAIFGFFKKFIKNII
jgi:hypothetical protein